MSKFTTGKHDNLSVDHDVGFDLKDGIKQWVKPGIFVFFFVFLAYDVLLLFIVLRLLPMK